MSFKYSSLSPILENKKFYPDPSVLKKYASFIIPLYFNGILETSDNLKDEWLESKKSKNADKETNNIYELEILALKNLFTNPLSQDSSNLINKDMENGYTKLLLFITKKIKQK